jgi:hypothetical protein
MSRACLRQADLVAVDLSGANLTKADLSDTDISEANFTGADLSGAVFNGTHLHDTIFTNVCLRQTSGLDTCNHLGPSAVDHRTFERSGRLPLKFLRGCGLPDKLIDYLPSLLNEPIQFYSCFISYSSKDQEFAESLHADLQNKGIRCWYAPEDMKIGDKIRRRIDEMIHVHERLLLILSENSVSSEWVEKEVETAFEKERRERREVLFPVRLDDAVMESQTGWAADIRRSRHIGDFTRWKDHDAYRKAFDRVVRDLRADGGETVF